MSEKKRLWFILFLSKIKYKIVYLISCFDTETGRDFSTNVRMQINAMMLHLIWLITLWELWETRKCSYPTRFSLSVPRHLKVTWVDLKQICNRHMRFVSRWVSGKVFLSPSPVALTISPSYFQPNFFLDSIYNITQKVLADYTLVVFWSYYIAINT